MNQFLRYSGVLAIIVFLAGGTMLPAQAQSGPGGVEESSGTSTNLKIWMESEEGVSPTTDGNAVTGWTNQSSGFADPSDILGNPTFQNESSDLVNGKPVIRFDGTDDGGGVDQFEFNTNSSLDGIPDGENTIIVVSANSSFDNLNQAILGFGDIPSSGGQYTGRGLLYNLDNQTSNTDVTLAAISGTPKGTGGDKLDSGDKAVSTSHNTTPFSIYSSTVETGGSTQDLLADGEVLDDGAATTFTGTPRIGERVIGDVAEVIAFDRKLNAAELQIVYNYLSTKYDLSLTGAVADKYRHDDAHPGDVAGIGRANGSIGKAPDGAKGTAQSSGLFIDIPTSLFTSGDYLFYGHDEANLSFTAVETPNGRDDVQKLAREWRVDSDVNFDANGNVNLGFDESVLSSADSIKNTTSYNDYFLFVDSDGDFSDGNAEGYDLSDTNGDGVYTVDDPTAQSVTLKDGDYVTVARVKRKINFARELGSGFENDAGTISLTARLNFETNRLLEVDAPVDPASDPNLPAATKDDDFTEGESVSDGTKTWSFTALDPPQDTRKVFTVLDDNDPEDTELLKVTPNNLPDEIALGDTTRFEYGILDEDISPNIEFASSNPTSVTEGNTTVTFDVETESGSGSGTAFFNITGDATAGEDYEITANSDTTKGEVSLSSGSGSFDITILDDNLSEADEDLTIEFFGAKNATLAKGGNLSQTLTINDDEGVPSVSFTSDTYSGEEGADVDVTLSLSASAGQDLDVKVQDDGTGDATAGDDYTFSSPKTVTIPSGNTQESFSVTLDGDGVIETTETIDLSIVDDSDTEPTLGTPDATTISILDNSAPGKVGPGGVGNDNQISLWLRPDEGVTTDGSGNVSTWADQSGNGNDATQTNSGERPAYGSTSINGISVVTFDGTDDFLRSNVESLPSSSNTLLSVANAGGAGAVFGVDNDSFESLRTLGYDGGSTGAASQNRVTNGNTAIGNGNAGGTAILSSVFDGSNVNIRENGGGANTVSAGTNSNGTYAILGGEPQNAGDQQDPDLTSGENTFGGDVAEFIAYDLTLNKAQRLIIGNYLAAKYSIGSLSTDLYAGDLGADGTDGTADDRDRDVIGVGQASDGTKHFSAQGGGFTLSVAGGIDNGDFAFAGRETGVTERINITDTSTTGDIGVTARINEDRYIDITGALTVDITLSFSDSDIVGPAGDPANYVLLRRTGTSGDWTKVTGGASLSSDKLTFTDVSLSDSDDGYFTIGTTDHDDSPLDTRYITVRGDAGTENDAGYYHFSAPTDASSATFGDIVKPDGSQAIDFSSDNPNPKSPSMVQTWDPVNQDWSFPSASDNITTGKGFVLWLDDSDEAGTKDYRIDPEYTFGLPTDAQFEDDNVTVSNLDYCNGAFCSSHGAFYLLGNPYLDAYDLQGLNLDKGNPDFQQSVIVWNARDGSYLVKSRTAGDKISRWQGFFVERSEVGVGTNQLTFDKTGRVSSTVPFVGSKSESATEEDDWGRAALALNAKNGQKTVSTDKAAVLFFHDSAETGWDPHDLSKRGANGPTLSLLGDGRDGSEVPKAQESRRFGGQESFTVDLQFSPGDAHAGGTFEIRPHQWEHIPENWTLTLIDTKGTSSTDDDEEIVLGASKSYQFEDQSKSTEEDVKAASSRPTTPNVKRVEKSSETPRFQLKVDREQATLPVEFSSVEAVAEGQDAVLKWKTATERGNAGFEVQHKAKSGKEYRKVGFVEGAGTSTEAQSYQYRLKDLGYGEHVFRLQQVDTDGTESLSKEVRTQIRLEEAYAVETPYPNPFRSQVTLDLTVRKAQDVQVTLYDALGRKVRRVYDERVPANETQSIRMRGKQLGSGMYFLRVRGEDFSEVRKVVHVK